MERLEVTCLANRSRRIPCRDRLRLEPGDVVLTGTPAGVGLGRKPQPVFLKPGDVVRLGASRLGEQCQTCVQV